VDTSFNTSDRESHDFGNVPIEVCSKCSQETHVHGNAHSKIVDFIRCPSQPLPSGSRPLSHAIGLLGLGEESVFINSFCKKLESGATAADYILQGLLLPVRQGGLVLLQNADDMFQRARESREPLSKRLAINVHVHR
jgi:hypothetical protein